MHLASAARRSTDSAFIALALTTLATAFAACERGTETPAAETPVAVVNEASARVASAPERTEAEPSGLVGRWRGNSVCLELYALGEFRLSVIGRGPKVELSGQVSQRASADGNHELELRPARIRRHRWVGRCRKRVVSAGWLESQEVLGTTLSVGAVTILRARAGAEGGLELCGQRCESLAAEEPRLHGRWRAQGPGDPLRPSRPWRTGELLDIELDDGELESWLGHQDGVMRRARGPMQLRPDGPDRFVATWLVSEIERDAVPPVAETEMPMLGLQLRPGERFQLRLRRRADSALEVCGRGDACVRLPAFLGLLPPGRSRLIAE